MGPETEKLKSHKSLTQAASYKFIKPSLAT